MNIYDKRWVQNDLQTSINVWTLEMTLLFSTAHACKKVPRNVKLGATYRLIALLQNDATP